MTVYSTIYAFGDSLSDAGNAWLLTNSPYASGLGLSTEPVSPPYFQETYSGITANVFSNGPVWTQDLSALLGLGTLAPSGVGAYSNTVLAALTPSVGSATAQSDVFGLEVSTGVYNPLNPTANVYIPLVAGASGGTDFAVGGAVTGPTAENSALSGLDGLAAQLVTFKRDVPTPAANALATVSIGGNDVLAILNDASFATLFPTGTTLANVASTTAGQDIAAAVAIEAAFLGGLIATGVTNVVVMNVPDIGKAPAAAGNATAATVLSSYFNSLLASDVAALNTGGVHAVIDDAFALIDNAVANPGSYSLTNVTTPVYSGSSSNYSAAALVSPVAAVQNTYLFFDKLHPTSTGENGLAQQAQSDLTACFATGTNIRTAEGEIPVEDLRIGALVVLADGGTAPIIWIGHRDVQCAADPAEWPVRVRAGAFGPGRPGRDLFLSGDHAVFTSDVLIPVRHLVDGHMIARVPRDSVTWWHVELPGHDVLLAEGLPCESFLDAGLRDDMETRRARRPDYVSRVWEAKACAPLIVTGPKIAEARARVGKILVS